MSLSSGTRLGPYEIQHLLGAGGMGEVYRAHDTRLGRDVALKLLPDAAAHDPDRRARFVREAHLLAALHHPNIATIFGVEEATPTEGGDPVRALVLELVDGQTLADRLMHGPLPLDEVLPVARQIADALDAAHAQGIVHRDLKPANITLRPDGAVKVLDFGLARLVEPGAGAGLTEPEGADSPTVTSPALTRLGVILGTAAYMSPEQARGRQADKRADIWAFGCVLYEMLTGRRTFSGETVSDTIASVLRSDPDWQALPQETPEPIQRLLRRCLIKDVHARLPDIGVARLDIADAAAARDDRPQQPRAAIGSPRSSWVRRAWFAGIAGAAGVALAAVLWMSRPAEPAATVRFVIAPPAGARFPTATTRSNVVVSPDGRSIVFRAYRTGDVASLWIRPLDATDARELRVTAGATMPFWSPDSRSIGFFADGALKKIDVANDAMQVVCEANAPVGGAWSANGTIVFGQAAGGLMQVPSGGGQPTPLTHVDATGTDTHHVLPVFLDDGDRFLFTAQPRQAIFAGSLKGTAPMHVVDADSGAQVSSRGYLLFARQGTILAQPFDARRAAVHGEPVPIAEGVEQVGLPGGGTQALFSTSRAGVLVYETAVEEAGGTPVWVDRSGRELGAVNPALGTIEFPRLSPDGGRLAAVVHRDVWIDDLEGRPPIRLTFDGRTTRHYTPIWTRDGRRVIYESAAPASLQSLPADGSSTTPDVHSIAGHFHPVGWSADGRDLVAVDIRPPDTNVVAFSIAEGGQATPRAMTTTPGNDGGAGAALSPDGRWLAYASNATGRQEIWVRPYPGPGAPVRVSPNGGDEPVWSRDGRELFYLEVHKMMAVAVLPGSAFRYAAPVELFEAAYMRGGQPPTYDVAPNGHFIRLKAAAGEEPGNQPVGVVVNWVDELERRAAR